MALYELLTSFTPKSIDEDNELKGTNHFGNDT